MKLLNQMEVCFFFNFYSILYDNYFSPHPQQQHLRILFLYILTAFVTLCLLKLAIEQTEGVSHSSAALGFTDH